MPESLRVRDMSDGGMGSLLLQPGSSISQFGLAKLYFLDEDGVLVTASLNATHEGKRPSSTSGRSISALSNAGPPTPRSLLRLPRTRPPVPVESSCNFHVACRITSR